ncbi:MAG: hypothetical protein N2593_02755 [Patescibacteria group bacterium]|nr:hypothetical protein [Patescibacteria group bacterium]
MKKIIFVFVIFIFLFFGFYYLKGKKINFENLKKDNLKNVFQNEQEKKELIKNNNNKSVEKKDNQNLFLEITSPKENQIFNQQEITIEGKTLPNAEVFINEKSIKTDSRGNFSLNYNLDEGENEITIIVNDDQGDYVEKSLIVQLKSIE